MSGDDRNSAAHEPEGDARLGGSIRELARVREDFVERVVGVMNDVFGIAYVGVDYPGEPYGVGWPTRRAAYAAIAAYFESLAQKDFSTYYGAGTTGED